MSKTPESRRPHLVGVVLVVTSALVFRLAGVLTKAIEADAWTIACWRGLLGGLLIAAYVAWSGRKRPARDSFRIGWRGWLLASVGSLASLAFIFAFKLTFIANVAVIYSTAPFMAAALSWWLIRERVQQRTLVAAVFSFVGVLIVVLAGGLSALQLFIVSGFIVDPLDVSSVDALLLCLFGVSFAVAVVLWTEGTRLIPVTESGLLGSAETPFAILLAWLVLSELPPVASFVGGGIILTVVFAHAGFDMARPRSQSKPTAGI